MIIVTLLQNKEMEELLNDIEKEIKAIDNKDPLHNNDYYIGMKDGLLICVLLIQKYLKNV